MSCLVLHFIVFKARFFGITCISIFYFVESNDIHTDGGDNDRLSDSREFLNVKNVVLIGADGDIVVKYLCLEWMENVRETNLKF